MLRATKKEISPHEVASKTATRHGTMQAMAVEIGVRGGCEAVTREFVRAPRETSPSVRSPSDAFAHATCTTPFPLSQNPRLKKEPRVSSGALLPLASTLRLSLSIG